MTTPPRGSHGGARNTTGAGDYRPDDEDLARLAQVAARLAPTLVGLPVSQARALVQAEPGLRVRFAEGAVTADYVYGRITAWVRDGRVLDAHEG